MWVVAAHPHIPLPCLLCVNRDESGIQSSPAAGCRWAPSTGRMREGGGRLDVAGKGSFQVLSGCVYPEARTSAALRGQLHPEPRPPPLSEPITPWRGLPLPLAWGSFNCLMLQPLGGPPVADSESLMSTTSLFSSLIHPCNSSIP